MSSANEPAYDRWVQCTLCSKWRCVSDSLRVDETTTPWRCAYNVFSATYNVCSAPQEEMPTATDAQPPNTTPAQLTEELFAGYARAQENNAASLFVESKCDCTLCTSVNDAVRDWPTMIAEKHSVPLIQCVLDAISKSEPIAQASEEDKRFLYAPDGDPQLPSSANN